MTRVVGIVLVGLLAGCAVSTAGQERLDFWYEAPGLFGSAPVDGNVHKHPGVPEYWGKWVEKGHNSAIALDYVDKVEGDFSVVYDAAAAPAHGLVGFFSGRHMPLWRLAERWRLCFWMKAEGFAATDWAVVLIDKRGRRASATLEMDGADGKWRQQRIALTDLQMAGGFDFNRVDRCEIAIASGQAGKLWLDGVRFEDGRGGEIAVTDKKLDQRVREIEETFVARRERQFHYAKRKAAEGWFIREFAQLWLDEDLDAVNEHLQKVLTTQDVAVRNTYNLDYHWDLAQTNMLMRIYHFFGDKSDKMPGRLYPETQQALLAHLWERTHDKNDIHVTKQSTWWLAGSENHDLSFKSGAYLSSLIFMNEPEYADRVYPDRGTGPGEHYWFHTKRLHGMDDKTYVGPHGRGQDGDSRGYTAADHARAWTAFFKEYIRERGRKGFFVELSSPTYIKYTTAFLLSIYDFTDDAELKALARNFLDVILAEWAVDQLHGVKGGAKTRCKPGKYSRIGTADGFYSVMTFLLGGDNNLGAGNCNGFLTTDYRLPAVVVAMALDREGLGEFAYASRRPGEAQDLWPRPAGLERSLLCDTESRLLRYSWVTPDYILGTQMDHPAAVHSHLSCVCRWQGITFPSSPNCRIYPRGFADDGDGWTMTAECFWRSAQHRNVLVTQQSRSFRRVHPDWFPGMDFDSRAWGMYFSDDIDRTVERAGWVFVQEGAAYAALRVVKDIPVTDVERRQHYLATEGLEVGLDPDCYEWNEDRTLLRLVDRFSPLIIEAGRQCDYPQLDDFVADILDNPLTIHNTVVPGWYTVTYVSSAAGKPIYFNAANNEIAMIDGVSIDYTPEALFDCPYLQSDYGSGVVTIRKGELELVRNFN